VLAHFENDAFLLTNVGRSSAYDVRVDFPETIRGSAPEAAVVEPDDFVKFLALRTLATHDDTVTVTWATRPDGGEERARWRRPLPSRPPLGPEPFVVWG
jgi:hypothetical protein